MADKQYVDNALLMGYIKHVGESKKLKELKLKSAHSKMSKKNKPKRTGDQELN
jgi:hypothetical protein